jgi:hypothetical protein
VSPNRASGGGAVGVSGCSLCGDKGMVRVRYESGDTDDLAICRCPVGVRMRTTQNAGRETGYALWEVWASREQIDPDRIFLIEDLMPELVIPESAVVASRESALLNASRKKPRL